jgi:hypothetical protein
LLVGSLEGTGSVKTHKEQQRIKKPLSHTRSNPLNGATAVISNPKENSAIVASAIESTNPGISNDVVTPKKKTLPTVSIVNASRQE